MTQNLMNEATPKSTIEKIHRKTRKYSHRPKAHGVSMAGRITPKKTGNNDPTRGGNRISRRSIPDPNIIETLEFVNNNINKHGDELRLAVESFNKIELLNKIVSHMVAVNLGGWKSDGKIFINEDGHQASPYNWELHEGRLVTKNGNNADFNIDWLLELRSYCDGRGSRSSIS